MSEVREHVVVTVLRVCLGVFLIVVGGEKFFRLGDFYEDILNYELVGEHLAEVMAFALPTVEVVVGIALVMRWGYVGGLFLTAGMMAAFIGALGSAWSRGLEISCGCSPWSADEKTNYPLGMGINVLLLSLTLVLFVRELKGEPVRKLNESKTPAQA